MISKDRVREKKKGIVVDDVSIITITPNDQAKPSIPKEDITSTIFQGIHITIKFKVPAYISHEEVSFENAIEYLKFPCTEFLKIQGNDGKITLKTTAKKEYTLQYQYLASIKDAYSSARLLNFCGKSIYQFRMTLENTTSGKIRQRLTAPHPYLLLFYISAKDVKLIQEQILRKNPILKENIAHIPEEQIVELADSTTPLNIQATSSTPPAITEVTDPYNAQSPFSSLASLSTTVTPITVTRAPQQSTTGQNEGCTPNAPTRNPMRSTRNAVLQLSSSAFPVPVMPAQPLHHATIMRRPLQNTAIGSALNPNSITSRDTPTRSTISTITPLGGVVISLNQEPSKKRNREEITTQDTHSSVVNTIATLASDEESHTSKYIKSNSGNRIPFDASKGK